MVFVAEEPGDCEDSKPTDAVESGQQVVNHHYYFPPHGNVNLQVGKDNKMYSGGAHVESPVTPDDTMFYAGVHDPNYNTTKHTVV